MFDSWVIPSIGLCNAQGSACLSLSLSLKLGLCGGSPCGTKIYDETDGIGSDRICPWMSDRRTTQPITIDDSDFADHRKRSCLLAGHQPRTAESEISNTTRVDGHDNSNDHDPFPHQQQQHHHRKLGSSPLVLTNPIDNNNRQPTHKTHTKHTQRQTPRETQ